MWRDAHVPRVSQTVTLAWCPSGTAHKDEVHQGLHAAIVDVVAHLRARPNATRVRHG